MSVTIQVELKPEAVQALREPPKETPSRSVGQLLEATRELGVSLSPSHPGVNDPLMAAQFFIRVPDHATADRVLKKLNRLKSAVEAAYVEPSATPPR